jgi:hypothetical protein
MRLSFTDMLSSTAYQREASSASKVSIMLATGVCLFVLFFRDWGFGYWWLLIVPALWFVVSFALALPVTLFRFWIASLLSETPQRARLATGLVDIVSMPLEVGVVFFGLRAFYRLVGS